MRQVSLILALLSAVTSPPAGAAEEIIPQLRFDAGPVNGVLLERDGHSMAIYGWRRDAAEEIEQVLLTHGRRDVLRAARDLVEKGTRAVAPARESYYFEKPQEFWSTFTRTRFHDYAQQSTKVLAAPLEVARWVAGGDEIEWRGVKLRVLETPGYTRGSVSYLTEIDGRTIAFTGDLIYGDGKLFDLYSFQDAIPAAQILGYHGYGSRLAALVEALGRIAAAKPDLIIPLRGPVIRHPREAIDRLLSRVRALYANYLSTNALHWYFKEARMRICGERVLGEGARIELMPYARHQATPEWVFEHSTSRLLISDGGRGFLLDCGYQRVIDAVKDLIQRKLIEKVDGIFVTHFHDDHTDMVQRAAEEFECPVYAMVEYADLLERPGAYHLPAMTSNPIKDVRAMKSGETLRWNEFSLTFHFFPGQTWYHGALFVRKGNEPPIFFIGDSFAPSGLDDYCTLNRNLLHEDSGYLLCLRKLRQVGEDFWLINEHIRYVFSFSPEEMSYLESRYRARIRILSELLPWDDPNYGVDEQWAVFYPYGAAVAPDAALELTVRVTNHSPSRRTFRITPRTHGGLKLLAHDPEVTVEPRKTGAVRVKVQALSAPGNYIVTADVASDEIALSDWVEALVSVE